MMLKIRGIYKITAFVIVMILFNNTAIAQAQILYRVVAAGVVLFITTESANAAIRLKQEKRSNPSSDVRIETEEVRNLRACQKALVAKKIFDFSICGE